MFACFLCVLLMSIPGFTQKQQHRYDSLIDHYNYLYNQFFAALEVEDTSGHLFKTSLLKGKTVYVDFWFTTCPPCIKEIPYTKELQEYFAHDTTIVFLSICIENIDRKAAWKQMIKEKSLPGVHLFYARNRPQKINLLQKYHITFPTYLLVNKELSIIGYDAPRPSEGVWTRQVIEQAAKNISLAESFRLSVKHAKAL